MSGSSDTRQGIRRTSGGSGVVAVDQPPDRAEDRALFLAALAEPGSCGEDPARETAERKRLQPHAPRSPERREEQPLPSEQGRLDLADELDVVRDGRLEGDD